MHSVIHIIIYLLIYYFYSFHSIFLYLLFILYLLSFIYLFTLALILLLLFSLYRVSPFHRIGIIVMQIALATGEAGHSSLVSRGRHSVAVGSRRRWWHQPRIIVQRRTRVRYTRTAPTSESLAERPAFRIAAGSGLARVPAIAHVHPTQRLG